MARQQKDDEVEKEARQAHGCAIGVEPDLRQT